MLSPEFLIVLSALFMMIFTCRPDWRILFSIVMMASILVSAWSDYDVFGSGRKDVKVAAKQTSISPPGKEKDANPYYKAPPEQQPEPKANEEYQAEETTRPLSGKEWIEDMRTKRDSHIFQPSVRHQDSDSRARLLLSMFQDLEDTNVKKDPHLLLEDKPSCSPFRERSSNFTIASSA